MGAHVRAKGVEWGMGICPHALLMRHTMHARLQACRRIGTRAAYLYACTGSTART